MHKSDISKELKYNKIFNEIKNKIVSYKLPPETQLLSVRELMAHYNSSYSTILRALKELEKYELIERKQGSGIYVKDSRYWNINNNVSNMIGIIVTDMNIPFFNRIISKLEYEFAELGYDILIRNSDFNSLLESEIIENFIERGVKGIVIVPTFDNKNAAYLESVDGSKVDIVYIIRGKKYLCNYIVPDDYMGATQGVNYLIDKGHKKIGYIGGEKIRHNDERFRAFKDCLMRSRLELNPEWIKYEEFFEVKSGYKCMIEMLNSKVLPTAVFCYTDSIAIGAMKACKERGLSVPEDISVIGCNNDEISEIVEPQITTMSINIEAICRIATDNLINILKDKNNMEHIQLKVPMELIERESVKEL